jgi:hypothetical protein
MTTNLYLRLNNLFPTDQLYRDVKNFKKKNTFPKDVVTESKKKAFEKKYKDFNLSKDENNLIYTPLNLQVVAKIYIGMILKKEYKNSFGAGVVAFYKTIRQKYLNIKRSDVSAFIKKQPIRQMTDVFKHRTNKPIISKFPNQLWCIDLIDVGSYESKNKKNVFIFNAIDVFSRKCFLEACKTKEAVVTRDALKSIIQRADVKPDYIICDNGKEFLGEFQAYCKDNGIKIRFNRAYSPQANGIVERCNQEIRKLMRNLFLQNENNNWIDHLRKLETTHNSTFTSAINSIPDKIWKKEKKVEDDDTKALVASNTILKNVKKQIAEYKDDELNVGDKVRIRMDALSNSIKRLVKTGKTKQIVVNYSPLVFKILKKITPRNGLLERSRYICTNSDGTRILVNKENGKTPRQFYANVLKKVGKDENDYDDISMEDAINLSGVKTTRNDVYSVPYQE